MAENVGHLREFDPGTSDWNIYNRRIENYFVANDIKDDKRKKAILLNLLSEEAYKLVYNLCIPEEPEKKNYNTLITLISEHFKPNLAVFGARFKFYSARKTSTESAKDWAARLRNLAACCEFEVEVLKVVLRDVFIIGYERGAVQDRLLEEKKTISFEESINIAATKSATEPFGDGSKVIKQEIPELMYVSNRGKSSNSFGGTVKTSAAGASETEFYAQPKCNVCGRKNHTSKNCVFRECNCHKCGNKGHLANICPQRKTSEGNRNKNRSNNGHNYLETENYALFNLDVKTDPITIDVMIDNHKMSLQLDTGASYSVVPEKLYKNTFNEKDLKATNRIFTLYTGGTITPLGVINCSVHFENKTKPLDLYVIKDAVGPPLLGRDFFKAFNLKISNLHHLSVSPDLNHLINKYGNVFSAGIGTFVKSCIKINLKDSAITPKFFRARPLPFAMKEKVENELERLENLKIISKVNYSEWGTPIVPVLKKDGSVRICGDFKVTINPHIEIDQYPLPRINELFAKMQGGSQFSKLDLSSAYQQVLLSNDSKVFTTISTHKGLFQYNRAPFGIASIPAKFQKIMESLLEGIQGVAVFIDDILITGKDRIEHLKRLDEVLAVLNAAGLKISFNKCQFFMDQVSYLGFIISKEGLHTADDKIEAINDAPTPSNVTQLKSFIGLINYYGSFVPNLATVLYPLYQLLKENQPWTWTEECEIAFKKIKRILTSAPILVHYRPGMPLKLITDASEYGLGAVITHIFPDNKESPIAYASRTLSPAEKNYSQVEKEGLAIIFALCKFNQYLYGRNFILETDSKALTTIFHPKKNIPQFSANRLRRWAVILSNYQYDIKFVPSKNNMADSLSRLPIVQHGEKWEDCDVNYINYFSTNLHCPINFEMIKEASVKDSLLVKIKQFVKNNSWSKNVNTAILPYYRIRNELSIEEDCLLWNNRLVIPETLRNVVLENLHLSHLGVVKMKSLARSYFYWPGIGKDIEILANNCESCAIYKNNPPLAAIKQWPWPDEVWYRVHIDFMGPFMNKQFLILVDAHSKWLEVYPMNNITTKSTIETLRTIFARFGLPYQLVSDNAKTFCSGEFKVFLKNNGIHHITSPPFHPASNGAAENSVKNVKNGLKNALGNKASVDINLTLCNFLFDYRNTEHCTTGVSPATLMFSRNLRTRFDNLMPKSYQSSNFSHCKDSVYKRVLTKQNQQLTYHRGTRRSEFQINEVVFVKNYKNVQKPTWIEGTICERVGKVMYLVKIEGLNNVVWSRHVNQIRRKVNYNSHPFNVRSNQNFHSEQKEESEGRESNNTSIVELDIEKLDHDNSISEKYIRPSRQAKTRALELICS